jgi:hypothetical protein
VAHYIRGGHASARLDPSIFFEKRNFGEADGSPFIGLEVKREGRRQSPEQKEFETGCKGAAGDYHVVPSIDDL